jgi:hypothetical protein
MDYCGSLRRSAEKINIITMCIPCTILDRFPFYIFTILTRPESSFDHHIRTTITMKRSRNSLFMAKNVEQTYNDKIQNVITIYLTEM